MADLEKVIGKIEEEIRLGEHWDEFFRMVDLQLLRDALELLKEQEHKDRMFHALEEDWKRLKKLLKEQEAKRGHWIDSAGDDKCSVCGATYSDLYPDYQNTHYCPNCGAKMEGR